MTATTEALDMAASRASQPGLRARLSRFGIFLILPALILIGGVVSTSFLSAAMSQTC